MKKKLFVIVILVLAVFVGIFAFQRYNASVDVDKVLTDRSADWDVHITMVRQGVTQMVMAPTMDFNYPETITVEFRSPDNRKIHTQELTLQRTGQTLNGYFAEFPTIRTAYKAGDAMIFVVSYNGKSEKVKLHDDTSKYEKD